MNKANPLLDNVWLVAFADSRLTKPSKRMHKQARAFGFREDHIKIFSERDLDASFTERMKEHLILGSRGFGYWCWKPFIILQVLSSLPENGILLYLDIGCHLNPRGMSRFRDYLLVAEKRAFCGFQDRSLMSTPVPDPKHHVYRTSQLTKGDVLDYFGVRENKDILDAGQIETCVFFLRKCEETLSFVREWKQFYFDDFSLMDDSPSRSPNCPDFWEHRHDQAAFSLMWLLRGYPTFSACEIEPLQRYVPAPKEYRHDPAWGRSWYWQMKRYPIWARRDKGFYSFPRRVYRYFKYSHVLPLLKRMGMA